MTEEPYEETLKRYSQSELLDIESHIDKEMFSEKYRLVVERIEYLRKTSEPLTEKYFTVIGFWLRLLTDIIDALFLGLIGYLLSIPFSGFFNALGENGLWIGLLVTFLYTGILQSRIGGGQSIAKRIFNIEVIGINGEYLSLGNSFLRYTVIALIFYNTWIGTGLTSLMPFLNNGFFNSLYTIIIIALFFGVLFLVPLHPLKRGIHDIIAGSIVIKKECFDANKLNKMNSSNKVKKAYLITGAFTLAVIGLMFTFYLFPKNKSLESVSDIYQIIEKNSILSNVQVNYSTFNGSNGTNSTIVISGFLIKNKYDDTQIREIVKSKVIELVKENYKELNKCNSINITIRTGYNIGILSNYIRENTAYNIDGTIINKTIKRNVSM